MNRTLAVALALAGTVALTGCASTSLRQSWKDPGATSLLPPGKVLVVAMSDNPSVRRAAEDELVRRIGADRAEASYRVLADADLRDTESAKRKVAAGGFNYALVLRPVSQSQELTYVPGTITPAPYRGGFWGYYGYGWGAYYDPGYVRTDTIVQIETLLYRLDEDKVVWAGLSETVNPSSAEKVVGEIAKLVGKDLAKKGLRAAK